LIFREPGRCGEVAQEPAVHPSRRPPAAGPQDEVGVRGNSFDRRSCSSASSRGDRWKRSSRRTRRLLRRPPSA